MKKYKKYFIAVILMFSGILTFANHFAAAEIWYEYLAPNKYKIHMNLYRDVSGKLVSGQLTIKASSSCGSAQTFVKETSVSKVDLPCLTSSPKTYEKHSYVGVIKLPMTCEDWVFSWDNCCRNPVNNALSSINAPLYVEAFLNNKIRPINNSPKISNKLIMGLCLDKHYLISQKASEIDGDSLVYSLTSSLTSHNTPIPYSPPFSSTYPFPTLNQQISIDSQTGLLDFSTTTTQFVGLTAIKVEEYTYDTIQTPTGINIIPVKIGSIMRDMETVISAFCKSQSILFDDPNNSKLPHDSDGMAYLDFNCADTSINISLSSPINCSSIEPQGTDFMLYDTSLINSNNPVNIPLINASSINCLSNSTDSIQLTFQKPLSPGVYYLVIKQGNDSNTLTTSCGYEVPQYFEPGGDTLRIYVNSRKLPTNLGSDLHLCIPPDSIKTFHAVAGMDEYYWIDIDRNDTLSNSSYFKPPYSGNFALYKNYMGCEGSDTINISINKTTALDMPDIEICKNSPYPNIKAPLHNGFFQWFYEGSLIKSGTSGSLQPKKSGSYIVNYTDSNSCTITDTFKISTVKNIHFSIGNDTILCKGDSFTLVSSYKNPYADYIWTFNGSPALGSTNNYKYSSQATNSGTYNLKIKVSKDCVNDTTVSITVKQALPSPEINCLITNNNQILYTWKEIPNADAYEVSLDSGLTWIPPNIKDGLSDMEPSNQESILVRAISHRGGCAYGRIGKSTKCTQEIDIPNVITPNGDGKNDFFRIPYIESFSQVNLTVFDRWGRKVYESEDYQNDWDGGKLSDGSYFYVITVNDQEAKVYKGYVTILSNEK